MARRVANTNEETCRKTLLRWDSALLFSFGVIRRGATNRCSPLTRRLHWDGVLGSTRGYLWFLLGDRDAEKADAAEGGETKRTETRKTLDLRCLRRLFIFRYHSTNNTYIHNMKLRPN
mmetsp:Transcript_33064/g.71566  ORF Transcript_33064/g.71566 Transcript_33064/m.71566 type:complete len:118 (+) Transcript_33064:1522-1875(+)